MGTPSVTQAGYTQAGKTPLAAAHGAFRRHRAGAPGLLATAGLPASGSAAGGQGRADPLARLQEAAVCARDPEQGEGAGLPALRLRDGL